MDAIMLALVAVALANADGHAGLQLSKLLSERGDRRAIVVAAFGAFLIHALVAAVAGAYANRVMGQGVLLLLVALALLAAAGALLWQREAEVEPVGAGFWSVAVHLLAGQFGNRSHFLIGALAATSGAGLWAAAGGLVGWTLAMIPFLAFGPQAALGRPARFVRWSAAAILVLWGLRAAMRAFGL